MTVHVQCSAPGKLVLIGEYSVLFGYPALVMAINRRARVEMGSAADSRWSVRAPGFTDGRFFFELDRQLGLVWSNDAAGSGDRFGLLDSVLSSSADLLGIDPCDLNPADIMLDTREFFQLRPDGSTKLGLGSSAALMTAASSALLTWGGVDDSAAPDFVRLQRTLDFHRWFQGGRGSGIDVAASLLGGVLEYRLNDDGTVAAARPTELPAGLHLVPVWTGRAASTSDFLSRLDGLLEQNPDSVSPGLERAGTIAAGTIRAARAGDFRAILDGVEAFAGALDSLGRAAGLEIFSDEHRELGRLAGDVGVRYKPSGAGGGDFGLGFTDDPTVAAAFAAAAEDAGYLVPGLAMDRTGVRCGG
jgi:phosphomevalonate kinase